MLLYLVRHAQTASSAVDSFNGRSELPLTERGREQARKLGERLKIVRFAAAVRSPLGRTKQTSDLIAPGLPQIVLEGLTEIDYGEWEGLSPEQARDRDPKLYDAWVDDPARIAQGIVQERQGDERGARAPTAVGGGREADPRARGAAPGDRRGAR